MDFKSVIETLKRNKKEPSIEEEALASKECPIHMVPLKENSKGELSCPFGHIYSSQSDF